MYTDMIVMDLLHYHLDILMTAPTNFLDNCYLTLINTVSSLLLLIKGQVDLFRVSNNFHAP